MFAHCHTLIVPEALFNVLLNSTEFSAKIRQDFCLCNEIKFELLAKVSITNATHYNTRACARTYDFSKILVSKCLSIEYQLVRLSFLVKSSGSYSSIKYR